MATKVALSPRSARARPYAAFAHTATDLCLAAIASLNLQAFSFHKTTTTLWREPLFKDRVRTMDTCQSVFEAIVKMNVRVYSHHHKFQNHSNRMFLDMFSNNYGNFRRCQSKDILSVCTFSSERSRLLVYRCSETTSLARSKGSKYIDGQACSAGGLGLDRSLDALRNLLDSGGLPQIGAELHSSFLHDHLVRSFT